MDRQRTHPGEVLAEESMKPLDLSARALGAAIGVPGNRVSDIIRQRRDVSADTAIRVFWDRSAYLAQSSSRAQPLEGRKRARLFGTRAADGRCSGLNSRITRIRPTAATDRFGVD